MRCEDQAAILSVRNELFMIFRQFLALIQNTHQGSFFKVIGFQGQAALVDSQILFIIDEIVLFLKKHIGIYYIVYGLDLLLAIEDVLLLRFDLQIGNKQFSDE